MRTPIDNVEGVATLKGFEGIFANVIRLALGFAGIALFVMLLIGGLKYITSGGDPKAAESARKTITFAILGMVLVASAYLLLLLIGSFTGADIGNFVIER